MDIHAMARTLYISLIAGAMPAAILERTFASVHLRDYEKEKRFYVVVISIVLSCSLVVGFCWDWFEDPRFIIGLCIYLATVSSASIALYLCLWRYNVNQLNKCQKDSSEYTLSTKFQLEENIRSFKLIRYVYYVVSGIIVSHCFLAVILAIDFGYKVETVIQIIIEFDVSVLVFPVYMAFILCVKEWRQFIMKLFRRKIDEDFLGDQVTRGSEGDVYFNQLTSSWI